ncbi:MAG: Ig domain-containing protein [Terriglobales bacterium]
MTGTKTVQIDALFNGTSGQTMNSSVQWTSSDKTVATVSSSGLVTGIKSSTTPVTITATAGSITASTTVTVNP